MDACDDAGKRLMRAREPDRSDYVLRDGVRIHYEIFGSADETIVFLPAWSILHSRCWKAQIPHFARYARVITFDGRGNGLSGKDPGLDYSDDAFAADALAVLDATHTREASLVGASSGARWALMLAARHPKRVKNMVFIAPAIPLAPANPGRAAALEHFEHTLPDHQGWNKLNRDYWQTNYRDFLQFFFEQCFNEPHSTKQIEDAIGWGLETTPDTLAATATAPSMSPETAESLCAEVRCPVLVIHGEDDRVVPHERGRAVAAATRARLLTLPDAGHLPHARIPIAINLAIDDFLEIEHPRSSVRRTRRKRALFVSSPIGLGHAQRDLAIAQALRRIVPDIEISWLAQHPVTEVLRKHGETIHPVSAQLVNESAHFESECAGHDLHAFQAI